MLCGVGVSREDGNPEQRWRHRVVVRAAASLKIPAPAGRHRLGQPREPDVVSDQVGHALGGAGRWRQIVTPREVGSEYELLSPKWDNRSTARCTVAAATSPPIEPWEGRRNDPGDLRGRDARVSGETVRLRRVCWWKNGSGRLGRGIRSRRCARVSVTTSRWAKPTFSGLARCCVPSPPRRRGKSEKRETWRA